MSKKTKRGDDLIVRVLKAQAEGESQFALALAYPADRPDASRAADGYRDYVTAPELERACWRYMVKSQDVGMHHQAGTSGAARIVESHIHRAPPWKVTAADGSQVTVQPGDWLVGLIFNDDAWAAVKSGRVNGLSPQGAARRSRPSKAALKRLRKEGR